MKVDELGITMEDELARRLDMVSTAMRQTLQESRALRSEAQERIARQKEMLWKAKKQREEISDNLGEAFTNIRLAQQLLSGDARVAEAS